MSLKKKEKLLKFAPERGGTQKGGFPPKRVCLHPGGNYDHNNYWFIAVGFFP